MPCQYCEFQPGAHWWFQGEKFGRPGNAKTQALLHFEIGRVEMSMSQQNTIILNHPNITFRQQFGKSTRIPADFAANRF